MKKRKKDIKEMVETAKYLAEKDPMGLMLAKNSMDILKAVQTWRKVKYRKIKTESFIGNEEI